jgi:hypothetical protein
MISNRRKNHVMLPVSACDKKSDMSRESSRFSKYSKKTAPALVVLVALVLLSAVLAKRSESKDNTSVAITEAGGEKTFPSLTGGQLMDRINRLMTAFNNAFHDPALIAYANEQGPDLPDSPKTSLAATSGQTPAPAKSLSTPSTRLPGRH